MKVKDAKKRIDNLKILYDNALKIQQYCIKNEEDESISYLEEKSNINSSLRTFATSVALFTDHEMKRIDEIIDNADVKIN